MAQEDQSSPHDAPATPEPSSRWSPDPFNPPISPNRPNGGYSTDEYPDSGLSKYGPISSGKDWRNDEARSPAKKVKMGQGALEKTFQRQQVRKEVEEEIRSDQIGSEELHFSPLNATEGRKEGGPETPTKKRKVVEAGQGQSSPSPVKGGKNGNRRGSSTNTTPQKGQADIRGFFTPNRGGS